MAPARYSNGPTPSRVTSLEPARKRLQRGESRQQRPPSHRSKPTTPSADRLLGRLGRGVGGHLSCTRVGKDPLRLLARLLDHGLGLLAGRHLDGVGEPLGPGFEVEGLACLGECMFEMSLALGDDALTFATPASSDAISRLACSGIASSGWLRSAWA